MLNANCSNDLRYTISKWNRIVFIPFLLGFGWLGNFMLYRIAQKTKYPNWSLHIKIIAIVDSLYLVGILCKWLEISGFVNLNEITNCGWNISLSFATSLISNWILFLHYVDKALFMKNNKLHQKIFSKKNTIIIVTILIVAFVIFMGHFPFILEYNKCNWDISDFPCSFKTRYRLWGPIAWLLFYKFIYILIPFTAIIVCASLIAHSVLKSKQTAGQQLKKIDQRILKTNIYLACYILLASAPYGLVQMITTSMNTYKINCEIYNKYVIVNVILSNLFFTIYASKFWILLLPDSRVRQNFCSILLNQEKDF